jgi:hypothetical protein
MTIRTRYLTGLLAVSTVLSTQAQDVMVSDFENNTTQGWANNVTVVAAPDVSLGSYSLQFSAAGQYWEHISVATWNNPQLSIANLNAGSQVSFDLYFPSAGWLTDHAEVRLEVWSGDPWVDIFGTQNLSSLAHDSVINVTFDLSSFSMPRAATWGGGIDIFVNPGYDWMWDTGSNPSGVPYTPQQVYIDNVQIVTPVPEPSTFALAGIGLAGLVIFRRRAGR